MACIYVYESIFYQIASKLGMQCGRATVKKFADGEVGE